MSMRTITLEIKQLKHLLLFGVMLLSINAIGQVQQSFNPRFSDVVNGDFTTIANNTVSATATGNYNGIDDNHDLTTVFVDIDTDGSTFNSSSANFSNPSPTSTCLTVTKAFLYWSAADKEYGDNTGNGGTEPVWNYNEVKLMLPGATAYSTITADQTIYRGRDDHFVNDPYVCVKDITTDVQALASPYGKFQVANVKGTEGTLRSHGGGGGITGTSGGWQIVFVYESPELVSRNVTLFDGYANVTLSENEFDVDFNGFQTVSNGAVNANVVIGSIEGDRSIQGDALEILDTTNSWVALSTAERPTNNFFTSKITTNETQFLDRNPASTNTLGFDASYFALQNNGNTLIANNQTSATVRMTSNQETYGLYLMGLSVEVFEPSLGALSFTTSVVGSNFNPGDNAPVEIRIQNVGNDDIQNLEIALTLPPQVEFLSTEPLPPGVSYNFDTVTRELRFFVQDGFTDINDPEYQLDFNLFVNNECVTCSADIGLQALATFTGVINPNTVGTLSSGTINACGIGNHDPTYLHVTPVLSINDASAVEGTNLVFTISSSHLLAEDALLNLTYNNFSASGSDYAIVNTFTVPTGTGNTFFNVPALDDTIIEITETFEIVASSIANITILDNTANGSILDNDLIPGTGITFTNKNVMVTEGTDTFAIFNVTLTGSISQNVAVDYTTNEGTALNPGDITTTTGTLIFTPTLGSIDIQVPITDDTVIEPTEDFTLILSNIQSNLGIGFVDGNTTDTSNATINDDDANTPGNGIAFTNTNVIVTEGTDAFAVYTVSLTGNISENVSVDYTTNEITALNPGDFTSITNTLIFTPSISTLDIQVPITDDSVIESQEAFSVTLSNIQSNLSIGFVDGTASNTATGTINDDDLNTPGTGIAFTNTAIIVTEGTDAFAVYTVSLTGNISENVSVDYTTNEGTALNPGDFTSSTNTLIFTPSISTLDIQVPITDDSVIESQEVFSVTLSNIQSNLGIGFVDGTASNTANGTINDDDANTPGTGIEFTNTAVIVTEGTDAFAVFTVSLTGNISENVSVDYTTNEGTALNPGDFAASTNTLTFTPSLGSFDIQVPITDDSVIEPQEAFSVILSNIQSNLGVGFVDGSTSNIANGTINDDDANTPGIGIEFTNTAVIVTEGTDLFAIYTVSLTGNISENVSVDYTTNEITALNPGDFTSSTNTLIFSPSLGAIDIQVPITDDSVIEPQEAFSVSLSNIQSNLGIGFVDGNTSNTSNTTIIDDDTAMPGDGIAFTNTAVIVTEGTDAFAIFTVTLTGSISENVSVDFSTSEGTALNPGDFISTTTTLIFTPTIGSFDVQVPITDDSIIEQQEAFFVTLSNIQSNLGIGFVDANIMNTANGTINDDDSAEIMVEAYTENISMICGDEIPEVPTLIFTGGCGNYLVAFTEVEDFSTGTDDFLIIRTWNVTDSCGNTASFEQVIFVMQREGALIEIAICIEDEVINLIDSLPADFDTNGTFTITQGAITLDGSLFDPNGLEIGEYLISYESTAGSCNYVADFIITVNADCLPCSITDLIVSKTITVNGDGINDFFEISGLENCGYTYNVKIFNRWGAMVYESQEYRNNWGGNAPGGSFGTHSVVPTGTYYYIIALSDTEIKPINGYVYIGSN